MNMAYSIRVKAGRWLCYLMMICLFNTILDSPARFTMLHTKSGPVAVNEIESIYEWLAEEVADIENAVPEQEDHNNDIGSFKKDKYDWTSQFETPVGQLQIKPPFVSYVQKPPAGLPSYILENNYPPPEYNS